MKKSTILTFVTAAAVLATSAGTFAVWDQTKAVQTSEFTLRKPLVLDMAKMTPTKTDEVGSVPIYTAATNLTLTDVPDTVTSQTHEIKYVAKVYKGYVDETNPGTEVTSGLIVTPTGETDPNAANHNVKVEVKPTDDDAGKTLADGSTKYTVAVTAELVAKNK